MEKTKERFESILKDTLQLKHESLLREVTFAELGADSLDEIELIMAMEQEFDIVISDDDAEPLKTIGEAFDYIKRRTA